MLSNEEVAAKLLSERLAMTAFIATMTRNYHMAEDVFQDVCVKAIGREEEFESLDHLVNWAHMVGRNRAIDLMRARDGKYLGLSSDVLDALSQIWPKDRAASLREKQEALQLCMEQLTQNNREILRLRYFEGRSGGDVARFLNRKLETVYQALARIHKSLGECVRKRMLVEGEA
ncbi:RNA polymerase sigma factor [Planctomicrobium sp. SH661]|uniref:RNA polymerase sigma factor n=1 Tax=Planctomicrobium sp. SH661 TaxID=3448124 RepID=UPI003F5B3E3B